MLFRKMVNNKIVLTVFYFIGFLFVIISDCEICFLYNFGWIIAIGAFWGLWRIEYRRDKHSLEKIIFIPMSIGLIIGTLGVFIQLIKVIF